MKFSRKLLGLMVASLALAAVGCTTPSGGSASPMPMTRAFVVTGNAGSTTVYIPTADGKDVVMMSNTGGKECPECHAAAMKYFMTGEISEKVCPTCHGMRTAVTVPGGAGHN